MFTTSKRDFFSTHFSFPIEKPYINNNYSLKVVKNYRRSSITAVSVDLMLFLLNSEMRGYGLLACFC